jgi:hypothetical protein
MYGLDGIPFLSDRILSLRRFESTADLRAAVEPYTQQQRDVHSADTQC